MEAVKEFFNAKVSQVKYHKATDNNIGQLMLEFRGL